MRWTERAGYRAQQFFRRLAVGARTLNDGPAESLLPESAYALFASMPLGDQQHGLCVLARLSQAGDVAPELAQAALLHDVGKAGAGLSLAYRVAIVVMEALCPSHLVRLSAPRPHGLRCPFHVHLHHAEIGAALCEQAGCSALTVRLVQLHKDHTSTDLDDRMGGLLAALRVADDLC